MKTLDIFNDIEDINEEEIKKDKDYGYLKVSNKKKELIKESLAHNIKEAYLIKLLYNSDNGMISVTIRNMYEILENNKKELSILK